MIFGLGKKEKPPVSPAEEKQGWLSRLKQGLSKTSGQLSQGIADVFTKRRLDDTTLEELEELLISADMGAVPAAKVIAALAAQRHEKELSEEALKRLLADEIAPLLAPVATPLEINAEHRPYVVLVVGVNGNGKTTTIGKLAQQWQQEGKRVILCAADTFRAAAVEQLQVWGERTGCAVVTGEANADAASVAYRALEQAKREQADILLVDTAGRLHNKSNLMAELQKIAKVMKKMDEAAPHTVLQVLDGTTGQNALVQVETFKEMVDVTGLIVTKLDGTARAGIVVALAEKFGLPVYAVGVGEGVDDLHSFEAQAFANNLVGL